MKKVTITIGIPAYNEERNISNLISAILKQKVISGKLEKILIISDASKDNTVAAVEKINDNRIEVIQNKKRLGVNESQNKIVMKSQSDYLLLFNADVVPLNNNFIENLLKPFFNTDNLGMVGAATRSAKPTTFVEKILHHSHKLKTSIYEQLNAGNTLYLCHGRARMLKKVFYKKLRWVSDCPEDAYSYLSCMTLGFDFKYQKDAVISFRSPATINDHIKQSVRFMNSRKNLAKYFDENLVKNSYFIPRRKIISSIVYFMIINPIWTFSYLALQTYIFIFNRNIVVRHQQYAQSTSTKLSIDI